MKSIFYFVFIFCLLTSKISFAQQTPNNQLHETIYYYSFYTATDNPITANMEQEIKQLKGVVEVKIKLKLEQKAGQITVVVQEKNRSSEGDIMFQPTDLKKIISENNFIPNELITEVID